MRYCTALPKFYNYQLPDLENCFVRKHCYTVVMDLIFHILFEIVRIWFGEMKRADDACVRAALS